MMFISKSTIISNLFFSSFLTLIVCRDFCACSPLNLPHLSPKLSLTLLNTVLSSSKFLHQSPDLPRYILLLTGLQGLPILALLPTDTQVPFSFLYFLEFEFFFFSPRFCNGSLFPTLFIPLISAPRLSWSSRDLPAHFSSYSVKVLWGSKVFFLSLKSIHFYIFLIPWVSSLVLATIVLKQPDLDPIKILIS